MGQRRNLEENKKYIKLNVNKHKTYQTLWDTAKVTLTGKILKH